MAEAGIPDFVMTSWGALAVPATTPPAIVENLSLALQEISREPGLKERFLTAGALFTPRSLKETTAFAAQERVKWKEVMRQVGTGRPVSMTPT